MSLKINVKGLEDLLDLFEELKKPIDKDTAINVGKAVVTEMKDLISKGISPILSVGKFPNYKNTAKYPRGQKPNTPVNLRLTGDFQDALSARPVAAQAGYGTEIFYSGKEDLKESGHRDGVNKQPKRPTIPQGGEEFAEKVQEVIRDIYDERITKLANK